MKAAKSQQETQYSSIARSLREAIRQGAYQSGEKLPSLREISRQHGVSLGTAVEALGVLQDEGWVAPRDRSGFYVSWVDDARFPSPRTGRPGASAVPVSIGNVAMRMVENIHRRDLVNLGAGIQETHELHQKNIARSFSATARKNPESLTRLSDIMGDPGLRRQIARLMTSAGVAANPQEILITNGCQESLSLALQAVTQPGDTIAVESPAFFGLLQAAEALHLKVVEMPIEYPDGVSCQTVEAVVNNHPVKACLLTPCFNNPTGVLMPDENKLNIVRFLEEKQNPLIEDDIFGFLAFEGPRPRVASAFDTTGNTILCSSFSKILSPGLRLGWIHTGKFTEQIKHRKFLANISTATILQKGMEEFLKRGAFIRGLRPFNERMNRRMLQMKRDVQAFFPEGTRMSQPQGGLYLWIELPEHVDGDVLYQRCLENGVSLLPGSLFSPSGAYRNCIRLAFSTEPPEVSREGIKKIASLIS